MSSDSKPDLYDDRIRHFKDLDDLFDNIDNEVILEWINEYAKLLPEYAKLQEAENKRKGYHKVYNERKKITLAEVSKLLDPDELKRIKDRAEKLVAGKEDEA